MEIYTVKNIEEADYGCEENFEGARALLTLTDADNNECREQVGEDRLAFTGIDIGSRVVFGSDGKLRPVVNVAAAVICAEKDGKKRVLAAQRGCGEYKGRWEFPGGKAENGEMPEAALVREIREELDTDISVEEHFCTVEYDYPAFHLSMECYFAKIIGKPPVLKEHSAIKWLAADELDSVDWLEADISVMRRLKNILLKNKTD